MSVTIDNAIQLVHPELHSLGVPPSAPHPLADAAAFSTHGSQEYKHRHTHAHTHTKNPKKKKEQEQEGVLES